ncbi:MAG: hypothetical protein ACRECH_11640 [Nitrososphaerales archaeon]
MVRQKTAKFEFNGAAKVITALFGFYSVVVTLSVYFLGPVFTVTSPLHAEAGSIAIFVGAFIGFRAAKMFGGTHNFMGRLMAYYSVGLLAEAISWVLWGVLARGQIPTGVTLIILGAGSIVGQFVAAFALLISAKALIVKIDIRSLSLILVSFVFSLGLSLLVGTTLTDPADRLVWSGIWPLSIFVQLSSGLILVSLLGKWYMARPIAYIAFAYVGYSVLTSLATMTRIVLNFSFADYWVIISVLSATSFYFVGFFMSQVRPRRHDLVPIDAKTRNEQS